MILSAADVALLTGKRRADAQRRELEHLGIRHRVRRDGTLIVAVADVPIMGTIGPVPGTICQQEPELMP
jgi:hypothetical protein